MRSGTRTDERRPPSASTCRPAAIACATSPGSVADAELDEPDPAVEAAGGPPPHFDGECASCRRLRYRAMVTSGARSRSAAAPATSSSRADQLRMPPPGRLPVLGTGRYVGPVPELRPVQARSARRPVSTRALHLLQLRTGVDAGSSLRSARARWYARARRLGAGSVQRRHQLGPHPLAQRVLLHGRLELGDQLRVAPEREVGLHTGLRWPRCALLRGG